MPSAVLASITRCAPSPQISSRGTPTRHYNQVPEHVHFNRQLLDLHRTVLSSYSGMYMDPRFRPVYGWGNWTQPLHSMGGQRPGPHPVSVPPPPPWAPRGFSDSIDAPAMPRRESSQKRGARDVMDRVPRAATIERHPNRTVREFNPTDDLIDLRRGNISEALSGTTHGAIKLPKGVGIAAATLYCSSRLCCSRDRHRTV